MRLNKQDMIKIITVLENNTNTMLEMEEQNYENNKQYMKMEQQLFHEKWKVRYLTRRLREIAPHEALTEEELKEDFRVRNEVTQEKHLARLNEIHKTAFQKGQLHTAMNAEVYRGKAAGLYVERKLIANKNLEDKTEEELEAELKRIEDNFGIRRDKDETE